jgi:5-methylcytosine-specific restriction endonuclease McrA
MWSNRKRSDPGLDAARRIAKERDKYTCRFPGCQCKKKLQVHHITPYSKNIYLRCDPNNMITLCKTHHKLITGKEPYYAALFLSIIAK